MTSERDANGAPPGFMEAGQAALERCDEHVRQFEAGMRGMGARPKALTEALMRQFKESEDKAVRLRARRAELLAVKGSGSLERLSMLEQVELRLIEQELQAGGKHAPRRRARRVIKLRG